MIKSKVFQYADQMLAKGNPPTLEAICTETGLGIDEVKPLLALWQAELEQRISFDKEQFIPDVPDSLNAAFSRIWQQAVEEAVSRVMLESKSIGQNVDEIRRLSDDTAKEMQYRQQELENRLREQSKKNEDLLTQNKSLEAEMSVLKSGLTSETTQRKQEEQIRSNVEHELAHLRKAFEDSKRTFDQRIKDEQRHALEVVSKADVDVRYYKNALEKLRDEVGKKESALTKEIHDQKAELAKKDVKTETQRTQIRSQEEELKVLKQEATTQSRELARCNAALLAETNRTKRLEDKGRELDNEIKRLNQKQLHAASDWGRRENLLRTQLKEKEEELMRLQSRIASLEKRMITQDEEIRRLNARL